jgi:hypothetical protein
MANGKQQPAGRRAMRGLAALAATVALGAGLLAAGSQAAQASSPGRIDGGVEDGTFSPNCLNGAGTADPGVLNAYGYRHPIGDVVRILVPWNIATVGGTPLTCLQTYLADAHAASVPVEVSLNRAAANANGPTISNYTAAVGALKNDLGGEASYITYLSAWNEPNNPAYLNNMGWATLAGKYFSIAKATVAGLGIQMIAGDFSSTAVSAANLSAYITAAGGVNSGGIPVGGIWATHPYSDVREFEKLMASGTYTEDQAGATAAAASTVTSLASELHTHTYGPGTRLWVGEVAIYDNYQGQTFSSAVQDGAALFLSGALGPDSLPGYLSGQTVPQVGRYIYLRADDAASNPSFDSGGEHVLQVKFPDCVYDALTAPAAGCP